MDGGSDTSDYVADEVCLCTCNKLIAGPGQSITDWFCGSLDNDI